MQWDFISFHSYLGWSDTYDPSECVTWAARCSSFCPCAACFELYCFPECEAHQRQLEGRPVRLHPAACCVATLHGPITMHALRICSYPSLGGILNLGWRVSQFQQLLTSKGLAGMPVFMTEYAW